MNRFLKWNKDNFLEVVVAEMLLLLILLTLFGLKEVGNGL